MKPSDITIIAAVIAIASGLIATAGPERWLARTAWVIVALATVALVLALVTR